MKTLFPYHFVVKFHSELRTEKMEWRKFMPSPGRQPIRPAQEEITSWGQQVLDLGQKLCWLPQMLKNVGADDEIESPQHFQVIRINIDPAKISALKGRH